MKWFSYAMVAGLLIQPAQASDTGNLANRVPDAVAVRVDEAPVIDGELNDAAWFAAAEQPRAVLSGWKRWNPIPGADQQEWELATQQRVAYVAYDEESLYIALQAFVIDLNDLREGVMGNPFVADCLEVHLNVPEVGYYQIGVDWQANLGLGPAPAGAGLGVIEAEAGLGDNYWVVEVRIPWSMLRVEPAVGVRFGFNLAANHGSQGYLPVGVEFTHLTWGPSFWVRQFESILELR